MASQSFFGRHRIWSVLLLLLLLAGIGGVVTYFKTDKGKDLLPTVENVSMTTSNITPDSLKAQLRVRLRNNVPVGLRVDSFRYVTYLDGTPLSRGAKKQPTVVQSNGISTLEMPVNVKLKQIAKKIKSVQRDSATVAVAMEVYPHLPGSPRIPVRIEKRVYIPKLPHFEVAGVDLKHLGLQKGEALVRISVTNYNPFPFTIRRVSYRFRISDDMDVRGVETKDVSFRKRGTTVMPIMVHFQPKALPKVGFKALFKAKKTPYNLTGEIIVAAGKQNPKDQKVNFESHGTLQDLKDIPK